MSDFKLLDGKVVINNLGDIEKLIQEKFPDGLESKRNRDFIEPYPSSTAAPIRNSG
jgi:hypothetical protein